MKIILLTALLFSKFSIASFNFDTDALCFKNGTEELREFGPLGRLGDKKGVCQGMSGIVSGFYEGVKFDSSLSKLTESEARIALDEVVDNHASGCKTSKVVIGGYANLQEFCKNHKKIFLAKSIAYNTDIAIREIVPHFLEFNRVKNEPVTSKAGLRKIHKAVQNLKKKLNEGRWPLLLYFSHVVSVHSYMELKVNGKLSKVTFGIYDSNFASSINYEILYSGDLPTSGQRLLWEITPERDRGRCL